MKSVSGKEALEGSPLPKPNRVVNSTVDFVLVDLEKAPRLVCCDTAHEERFRSSFGERRALRYQDWGSSLMDFDKMRNSAKKTGTEVLIKRQQEVGVSVKTIK